MRRFLIAAALALALSTPGLAQPVPDHIISIYRAAPGHQVELVKWFAEQDRVAEAAGLAPMQLYVHANGADWDFVTVQPAPTAARDTALGAAARRLGVTLGVRSGLELRKHVSSHTDTIVRGPITAAQYLRIVGQE